MGDGAAMSTLPILRDGLDELAVTDPDTGELAPLRDATDRALVHAAEQIAEHDRFILDCKRALALELRQRHGVGKTQAGGYAFTVTESTSWPLGATDVALADLEKRGIVSAGDVQRCMPAKPRPDGRQLKALLSRLMMSDPVAAQALAEACTVSAPSVREVHAVSIDAEAA